jgi:hypothetical protein
VSPHEEGFSGQCDIIYGPIHLERSTQDMLAKCINSRYLDIACEGKTISGTNFNFNQIKCDKEEIQFWLQSNGSISSKLMVTKDMTMEPIGNDGLQAQLVQAATIINIKLQSSGDRDLLVMFIQYMIKRKTNGELQLKQTGSESSSKNREFQRSGSIPDHTLSRIREPLVQPQTAMTFVKGPTPNYVSETPSPQVYQSTYYEPNNYGKPQSSSVRDKSPVTGMTSSLYMLENPRFVTDFSKNKRVVTDIYQPTYTQGNPNTYTSNRMSTNTNQFLGDLDKSIIGPNM